MFFDLLFESSAFCTTLLESSRDHNRGLDPGVDALCNDGTDRDGRSSDYGQVHWLRDVANALVSFVSENLVVHGVNGIDFSAKGIAQQVLQNGSTYGAGTTGGADDGHRSWGKHCVQAVFLRGRLLLFIGNGVRVNSMTLPRLD